MKGDEVWTRRRGAVDILFDRGHPRIRGDADNSYGDVPVQACTPQQRPVNRVALGPEVVGGDIRV